MFSCIQEPKVLLGVEMKRAVKKTINKHKQYQTYANRELTSGRLPIKYRDFTPATQEPTYFKGIKRTTIEARLKEADPSLDWERDKPSARIAATQRGSEEAEMRQAAVKKLRRKK